MPSRCRTGTSADAAAVKALLLMIRRSALRLPSLHDDGRFAASSAGVRTRLSSKTSTTRVPLPLGVNDAA